jgi:hypothetical protein
MHEIIQGEGIEVLPLVFTVGSGARGFEEGIKPDGLRQHTVSGWFKWGELEVAKLDEGLLPEKR